MFRAVDEIITISPFMTGFPEWDILAHKGARVRLRDSDGATYGQVLRRLTLRNGDIRLWISWELE